MEFNKIENLAEILNEKNLTAIEIQEGDLRIRVENNNNKSFSIGNIAPSTKEVSSEEERPSKEIVSMAEEKDQKEHPVGNEVVSPLVGVVYLSPSPESDPFVSIGQHVKQGDVLCIIEAMKMLNEIAATEDGIISQICVENAAVVDYGACLFRIRQE
ncbi:MAG: acetyl-CoA carboxylase biotin carboxyl carrier protein [Clostridia bacterium]|nr:acetyl-CoA carboxylase biotin carboxyl carrier protein [Clostridia bacterium]